MEEETLRLAWGVGAKVGGACCAVGPIQSIRCTDCVAQGDLRQCAVIVSLGLKVRGTDPRKSRRSQMPPKSVGAPPHP